MGVLAHRHHLSDYSRLIAGTMEVHLADHPRHCWHSNHLYHVTCCGEVSSSIDNPSVVNRCQCLTIRRQHHLASLSFTDSLSNGNATYVHSYFGKADRRDTKHRARNFCFVVNTGRHCYFMDQKVPHGCQLELRCLDIRRCLNNYSYYYYHHIDCYYCDRDFTLMIDQYCRGPICRQIHHFSTDSCYFGQNSTMQYPK